MHRQYASIRRVLAAVILAFVILPLRAHADPYTIATEPPRIHSAADAHARMQEREIHERFGRGLAALATRRWIDATTEFERVVDLRPSEPRMSTALYNLAIGEAESHQYQSAMRHLSDALRRDPGFAAAAANLVTTALAADDIATARSAAAQFSRIAPQSILARFDRALTALRAGDLAEARTEFTAVTQSAPQAAIAHYNLALVEIRQRRYIDARSRLIRAVDLAPHYAQARFALATVMLRLGTRREAKAQLDVVTREARNPSLRLLARKLLAETP